MNPSCQSLALALLLVSLATAGVLDLLYREVPPEFWLPVYPLAIALGASYSIHLCSVRHYMVYLFVGLAITAASLVLYLAGLLGGADVAAYGLVAVGLPCPLKSGMFPPILDILLVSLFLGIAYSLYASIRACRSCGCCEWSGFSVRIPAEKLLEDERFKWWIPRGVDVEEVTDYQYALAERRGELVEASPGIPHLALLAVSILLYIVGVHLLEAFLGLILSL